MFIILLGAFEAMGARVYSGTHFDPACTQNLGTKLGTTSKGHTEITEYSQTIQVPFYHGEERSFSWQLTS